MATTLLSFGHSERNIYEFMEMHTCNFQGAHQRFFKGFEGLVIVFFFSGDSANAVPHTKKLRTRVTHIWGNRRRQPNRSAMEGPLPGRTALLITVSPVPGKYDLYTFLLKFIFPY